MPIFFREKNEAAKDQAIEKQQELNDPIRLNRSSHGQKKL